MNFNEERSPLHRLGSLGVAVAMVPAIVGFATANWLHDKETEFRVGLWLECSNSECKHIQSANSEDFYNVARCFAAMALCIHIVSVVTGCCCKCLGAHDLITFPVIRRWEEIAAIIAAGLLGTAVAVFADSTKKSAKFANYAFDWSFWLSLFAVVLLALSAIVITLGRNDCACARHCRRKQNKKGDVAKQTYKTPTSKPHSLPLENKLYNVLDPTPQLRENTSSKTKLLLQHGGSKHQKLFFCSLEGIPRPPLSLV